MLEPGGLDELRRGMLQELREPYLIATPSGQIVAANAACAEVLGVALDALDDASLASMSPDPASIAARLEAPLGSQLTLHARDGRRCFGDARRLAPDLLLIRITGGGPRAEAFDTTRL